MIQEKIKEAIARQVKECVDRGLLSAKDIDELVSDIRHCYFEYLRTTNKNNEKDMER